jgi:hypothetical protein
VPWHGRRHGGGCGIAVKINHATLFVPDLELVSISHGS